VLVAGCDLGVRFPEGEYLPDGGGVESAEELYARTLASHRREIVIEGSMSILDHERLASNERVSVPIHLTTLVSAWTPTADLVAEGCAGDEVRVVVWVWVGLETDDRTVDVLPTAALLEGGNCRTDDLEDLESTERLVGDPPESLVLHVEHSGSGGGDYADVSLTVTNTAVPIIDEGGGCDDDQTVACVSDGVSNTHCDLGSFTCVRDRERGETCDVTTSRRVCGLSLRCLDGVCAP
jgi:hypothetical protein